MKNLAEALDLPLAQCTFICLPGHTPDESFRNSEAQQWIESFREQYLAATQNNNPVYFIGFSLGGLVMTYLLGTAEVPPPKKQVLLAPALAFKPWSHLPEYFPSLFDNLVIPAHTPKKYKVHTGVTISGYKALFALKEKLEQSGALNYNIPTLVLCDQHDELVSPQGLQEFINQKKLTRWELEVLASPRWQQMGRKHLMVAKEYRSEAYWQHLKTRILSFLHE